MDKNTQQPVAWCELTQSGKIGYFDGKPMIMVGDVGNDCHQTPLFTAPPVPRDVLMAALYELSDASLELNGNGIGCDVISAIADRYASQKQPEPVNQQLLAALKMVLDDPDALDGRPRTYKYVMEAIAAAEAAQPVLSGQAMHMPSGFTFDEVIAAANHSDLVALTPQPASAKPVAVPECPFPCGWQQLHKLAVEDGAYLARSIDEDEPVTANARATTMRVVGNLIAVTRAMLPAAHKPEGV